SELGISFLHVTHGQDEALALADEVVTQSDSSHPDIIFLDLNLPRIDGWEILEQLEALDVPYVPPVIILTTSNYDKDEARSKDFSVVKGFLSKPLEIEHLQALKKDFIDGKA
ncbi:MAG: response regulator, partial [Bacteroidota bacterium]